MQAVLRGKKATMALINFDCPECGHNLEVDEGGAGFIVKCPECGNPLQIPELPKSHRIRKAAVAAATLLAILGLGGANLYLWARARGVERQAAALAPLRAALQGAQALNMAQGAELERLQGELAAPPEQDSAALAQAALAAVAETEELSRELGRVGQRLLENSPEDRLRLLRGHMAKLVQAAKNDLPAAPVVTDVGPGQGVQGRKIVFPVLPGPDGQELRKNAVVAGVEGDKVSVLFEGGTATYLLSELHPGVAAFLPVDPLQALPRRQRDAEVARVFQTQQAERDEKIAQLRAAVETQLPTAAP
jgi:predicted RNA-binding Zn-ribbon protein involved in translation (DUF1610 family)